MVDQHLDTSMQPHELHLRVEGDDFIDFLRERDQDQRLRRDYARASEAAKVIRTIPGGS